MLVSAARPREIVDWFHREDRQHEVLCFYIATADSDRELAVKLLDGYIDLEAAMGRKVGLVFFHEGSSARFPVLGGEKVILGERMTTWAEDNERLPYRPRRAVDQLSHAEAAHQSARVATDFIETFGIKYDELPCIVAMVKGLPECYVVSAKHAGFAELRAFLIALSNLYVQDAFLRFAGESPTLIGSKIREALSHINHLEVSISGQMVGVASAMNSMLKSRTTTAEDWEKAARFLADRNFSEQKFDELLRSFSFADDLSPRAFTKLRHKLRAIDAKTDQFIKLVDSVNTGPDIEAMAKGVSERRDRLSKTLRAYSRSGLIQARAVIPIVGSQLVDKLGSLAERTSRWIGLAERTKALWQGVSRLLFP